MSIYRLMQMGAARAGGDSFFIGTYSSTESLDFDDVAVDSSGNIVVGGTTRSFNNTGDDVLLLKVDPTGQPLWTKAWGINVDSESFGGLAIDSLDNIVVCGRVPINNGDVLVGKFSSSGVIQWSNRLGGSSADSGSKVAIASDDTIIVVGTSSSSPAVSQDVLIYPLGSNGAKGVQRLLGFNGNDSGSGVTFDTAGNIYVSGIYSTTSGSGGIGGSDCLVMKFNASRTLQWVKVYGSNFNDFGKGVAVDSLGNVYFSGSTGPTYQQSFLVKLDSAGNLVWQKGLGSSSAGNTYGLGVAVDENDDIVVTGRTNESGVGTIDFFVAKYDPSGNVLWQNTLGIVNGIYIPATVKINSLGSIILSGRADLGGIIAKLPGDGSGQGSYGDFIYQQSTLQEVTLTRSLADPGYYNQTTNYVQAAVSLTEQNVSLSTAVTPI